MFRTTLKAAPLLFVATTMALATGVGSATAQAPAAPNQPQPTVTTAAYENWVLRCVKSNAEADKDKPKQCEIIQTIQVQGQQQPIAQIALGHRPNEEAAMLTAVLPVNVTLPGRVFIATTAVKDQAPTGIIELSWFRCIQGTCFANTQLKDEDWENLKSANQNGLIGFVDASGRKISVPLSWAGFTTAVDALEKEPK
ncbi:invasion associated locus B family protein [uncultured Cohaesibacter sp.]|uniref:invasion associated locus B family protein n=1 Tax=uncultured Cohaesibacter sp. TaxID=1002546 RepID=UPI0029C6DB51|nr:invasion associated locus B family protein [uncultured Cohaesibacter sp.]